MSDLVGNPTDLFYRVTSHISVKAQTSKSNPGLGIILDQEVEDSNPTGAGLGPLTPNGTDYKNPGSCALSPYMTEKMLTGTSL